MRTKYCWENTISTTSVIWIFLSQEQHKEQKKNKNTQKHYPFYLGNTSKQQEILLILQQEPNTNSNKTKNY